MTSSGYWKARSLVRGLPILDQAEGDALDRIAENIGAVRHPREPDADLRQRLMDHMYGLFADIPDSQEEQSLEERIREKVRDHPWRR